jgi:hypothetical protein
VGAVVLARRRGGIGDADEPGAAQVVARRPVGTGTVREAVDAEYATRPQLDEPVGVNPIGESEPK